MSFSPIKLSEIKSALKREELNFKIKNSELNGTERFINFIDTNTKAKLHGKIVRSFNEGEVYHWPLLNHENVARLIDILCIRDNLYIYLTIDHEVTLKDIVHDKNFVYDARCFNRKLSYAKGIFSGLNYLHEKSLSLMNICDDNIIISEISDTAIITNFDHLTCVRKATTSTLYVPQMYMAPETEKGEFDAIKAEIWASGTLMLDMFLAHMVPWAIIDYKPKKIMRIVEEMTLDLLQAANAGSVVSEINLAKFKVFLKRFFDPNPLNRMPAKYASIASFLQTKTEYKEFRQTSESIAFAEDMFPLDCSILGLAEENSVIFSNQANDLSFDSLPKEQMIIKNDITNAPSSITQQNQISEEIGEMKTEIDLSLKNTSNVNSLHEKEELSSLSTYNAGDLSSDTDTTNNLQKITKSLEATNQNTAVKTYCNSYQTRSLSFISPKNCDENNTTFQLRRSSCYSNGKFPTENGSADRELENSDICFNHNDDSVEFDNNPNNNANKNNLALPSDFIEVEDIEKSSESTKTRHLENELQIEQRIPYHLEYKRLSVQGFKKPIAKPPRYSRNPPLLAIQPEIQSIVDKIVFLRKCYISIQTHERLFISDEFARRQRRFIREYEILINQENFRLRQILRNKYELKFDEITKLIRSINLRVMAYRNHENSSLAQNFNDNHRCKFLQTREVKYIRQVDVNKGGYCKDEKLQLPNSATITSKRNYSYYRAIENCNTGKNLEITCVPDKREAKEDLERINLAKENKLDGKLTSLKQKKKELKKEIANVKMMKQDEQIKNSAVEIVQIKDYPKACSENAAQKSVEKKVKKNEISMKEKTEKKPKKLNRNKETTEKKPKKLDRNKETTEKKPKKLDRNKVKLDEKALKKQAEKKLRAFKQQDTPKKSWLSFLCPRGKVEEPTPLSDALCETCKLNLQIT